jgi:hypothetical protein
MSEAEWKRDAFDSLILGKEQKLILQALISSHAFSSNVRDQVKQKDRGLVILLYGSPGSGKTFTPGKGVFFVKKKKLPPDDFDGWMLT